MNELMKNNTEGNLQSSLEEKENIISTSKSKKNKKSGKPLNPLKDRIPCQNEEDIDRLGHTVKPA